MACLSLKPIPTPSLVLCILFCSWFHAGDNMLTGTIPDVMSALTSLQ